MLLAIWMWFAALARTVPAVDKLAEYEPAITSRVHAGDGALIAEFAREHRVFVPYDSIPKHLIEAFVSAEDKTFFEHGGLDYKGMTRGILKTLWNKIRGRGGMQGWFDNHSAGCQKHAADTRPKRNAQGQGNDRRPPDGGCFFQG